jgi:tRNA-splicing ligase RtcB
MRGYIEITTDLLNIPKGSYLALLSHSGSRGLGANVAKHYTDIAMDVCRLEKSAKHLAYLSMDSHEGQEYWAAMNLAGDYAKACHDHIHSRLAKETNIKTLAKFDNHHNFAWKEQLNGKEVIVHRKGATPAHKGVVGIIPGSMTAPGYVVVGKGNSASINSASHGAGRVLSRSEAKRSITGSEMRKYINDQGIDLIGGGVDESPFVYKDIEVVIKQQLDLVDIAAKFYPKIVKMA